MKAEDLLIIGAIGAGAYFWWQSTQTAAASGTPAVNAPSNTTGTTVSTPAMEAPAPLNPLPMTPAINVQPSTAPLSNPISSIPNVSIMPVGTVGTPVQFVPATPPPSVATSSGTPTPAPTVQPGVVMVAPAPVATITPNPIAAPSPVATVPASPASAPAPIVYNPVFSFQTSSGGTNLDNSGGTWTASITGAPPYARVSLQLTDPNNGTSTSLVGSADGNGNFSYTGSVGNTTTLGTWQQKWYVLMPDNSQRVVGTSTITVSDSLVGLLPAVNPGAPAWGFTGYNPYTTPTGPANPQAIINSGGLTPYNI